jgi:hypothetical protein
MCFILSAELNVAGDKVRGVQIVPFQRHYMRVLSADIAGCWSGQDKLVPSSTELTRTGAILLHWITATELHHFTLYKFCHMHPCRIVSVNDVTMSAEVYSRLNIIKEYLMILKIFIKNDLLHK